MVFLRIPVGNPESGIPLIWFADRTPPPVTAREAPDPTSIAAVVFVPDVNEENATVLTPVFVIVAIPPEVLTIVMPVPATRFRSVWLELFTPLVWNVGALASDTAVQFVSRPSIV